VKKPKPTFDWADIDAVRNQAGIAVAGDGTPPGAFTVEAYASRYGVARSTAAMQLGGLVRGGKLMAGFCYKSTAVGRRRVRCYWPLLS
jgi:hypothetical protein